MGREEIVNRILADADAEAAEIIRAAQERAAEIVSAAEARAKREHAEVAEECAERAKRISEGKAAAARLDSAKILLAEKRRVLDTVYARALEKLLSLGEKECLAVTERLLRAHAGEGDEILFAADYPYAESAARLAIVKERNLSVSSSRAPVKGGFVLIGAQCDKDLSFSALLYADMEEHQAELAAKLFKS